jgi:hypothetical protein
MEKFIILEGMYQPETTGLSFSPGEIKLLAAVCTFLHTLLNMHCPYKTDLSRVYFAFQEDGMLFEVLRIDGLPFNAKTVNLKK